MLFNFCKTHFFLFFCCQNIHSLCLFLYSVKKKKLFFIFAREKFVILLGKIFYSCEKIFGFAVVRNFFYSCEENFDLGRFAKKALFKNVVCAFFISFWSYGSFLWLRNS